MSLFAAVLSSPPVRRCVLVSFALAWGGAAHAAPPSRPDVPGLDAIAASAIGAVEVFSAADCLSTGYFEYNDRTTPTIYISTARLPFNSYLTPEGESTRWFLTGSAGLFGASQLVETPATGRLGEYSINSLTVGFGLGCDIRLTDWLTLTPRAPLGYAYVEFDFERQILPGDPLAGAIPDWSSHAISFFPSLELRPEWRSGAWRYGATSRFTVLYAREVRSLNELRRVTDANIVSSTWRTGVFAAYDSPLRVSGMPVRFHGAFARNDLFGDIRSGNFTDHFYEISAGVGLVAPSRWDPVTEVGVTCATYFGPRFTGVSFGLLLSF